MSVVPLLCHFVAECGHDEGGIIVGREVSLMESFSVLNVILVADPISVLKAMEEGEHHDVFSVGCLKISMELTLLWETSVKYQND